MFLLNYIEFVVASSIFPVCIVYIQRTAIVGQCSILAYLRCLERFHSKSPPPMLYFATLYSPIPFNIVVHQVRSVAWPPPDYTEVLCINIGNFTKDETKFCNPNHRRTSLGQDPIHRTSLSLAQQTKLQSTAIT